MHKWVKLSVAVIALFSAVSHAALPERPHNALVFEIILDQFTLDKKTVEKASIEEKNGNFSGLHIKLKADAEKIFERVTRSAMTRRMNLVLNNRIVSTATVQSPLGGELLITGITKEDALQFIDELNRRR